ncbi:MAG TPA: hypothetical protein VHG28_23790 [Longimicrobiaceae bacterium]|nr:hypothetical protein [Longimicrobiaceae bacterium]
MPEHWREVRLHPFLVQEVFEGDWAVVRLDGKAVVRARAIGAEAVRLIGRYPELSTVRLMLRARYGYEVDLIPLLQSLHRAGLVRAADGEVISTVRISTLAALRCYWRCRVDLPNRVPRWLLRNLPSGVALALVTPLRRRLIGRSPQFAGASPVAARLPRDAGAADPDQVHSRRLAAMARQDTLTRLLVSARPAALDRWLGRRVRLEGQEHLDRARSGGRGVVIAFLHHGPFPLVPVKLLSRGYPVHGFHWFVDFAGRDFSRIFAAHQRECGWAEGAFYGLPNLPRIATFVRAVSAGGIALVMPDFFDPRNEGKGARDRAYRGGPQPGLPASIVEVPLGERTLLIHNWVGWLARRTGAVVLPARAWEEAGGYRVRLGPPVECPLVDDDSPAEAEARITRAILGELVPQVIAAPEQWTFLASYRSPNGGRGE